MDAVCVVDDELSVRKAVVNLLKSEGYQAVSFPSGESLLNSEWKARASCLLMDLNMPGLSGRETYGQLCITGYRIPIVYMSAEAEGVDVEAVRLDTSVQFLAKPFTAEALLATLARATAPRES